jgi:hypothetical protein
MNKIRNVLSSYRQYFRETLRYTRGGEPIPEALDGLAEFLSDREDLSCESWASDICRDLGVSAEVAAFAFDFFASQGVPIGRVRPGDRLTEDLNLTEALRDDCDLSGMDETRMHRGIYSLARLLIDPPPASFSEALSFLKPKVVQDAEARGAYIRRQGEWFAIPTNLLTSQLFGDVGRGVAVRRERHVLGRDGHHQLEEAVIYGAGPRKGEVYARGVLSHAVNEHVPLDLGFRWLDRAWCKVLRIVIITCAARYFFIGVHRCSSAAVILPPSQRSDPAKLRFIHPRRNSPA